MSKTLLLVTLGTCLLAPPLDAAPPPAGDLDAFVHEVSAAVADHGGPVLLGTLKSPDTGEALASHALMRELERRLGQAKVATIDSAARQKSLEEAGLAQAGITVGDWGDVAGGLGAKLVVVGSSVAGNFDLRLLVVETGAVVASQTGTLAAAATPSGEAKTLAAQLRRLADRLAAGLDGLDGTARYQRFAVLNFDEVGTLSKQKQLGLLVSAELSTLLRRDHGLMLVERAQLASVLGELAFGLSGAVDDAQAAEVGRLSGAQALVLGSVSDAGGHYMVNAKIVSTAAGRVEVAESISLPASDLVALSSEAVVLRSTSGSLYRSILLPGWGQFYNRQPVKAGAFVAAEVTSVALAVAYHVLGGATEQRYVGLQANQGPRYNRLRTKAEGQYKLRNAFLIGLAAIHLLNIVDAFVTGRSFQSAEVGGN